MSTHLEHKTGVPARDVTFTLQWRTLTILVPSHKKKKYQNVTLTAILVTETEPPEGAEPLSWLLLTSLKVETFAQAALCVVWYRLRWLIERYHFVLKSGCGLENLQLETAERLERALATFCVVAWRLLWLTGSGPAKPLMLLAKQLSRLMNGKPFMLLLIKQMYFHQPPLLCMKLHFWWLNSVVFLLVRVMGNLALKPFGVDCDVWMT